MAVILKQAEQYPWRVGAYNIVPISRNPHHSVRPEDHIPPNELYGRLHAVDPEGNVLGKLTWAPQSGKPTVHYVETHPDYRRQGIATALLDHARENYVPNLVHEKSYLTPEGKAWAEGTSS